ncbi:hypothetical protein SDC9_208129 [bioreactor metagenome]|uniref:Zinc protease n=1 Tax=bioreactor metagenome TaxID=1076179 RepID=A0A645J9V7_9ZZZZ
MLQEINDVLEGIVDGITREEFDRALAQVKASYIMGLETVAARASYIGRNELVEGRQISSDEVLEKLDSLVPDDIGRLASQIIGNPHRALSVAGDIKKRDFYKSFLPCLD